MPTHYSHIYNATPGSAPLLGDLVTAEIGVNTADLKLFVHDGTAIQDMGGPNDYVKIAPSVGGNKIQPAAGQNMTPIISNPGKAPVGERRRRPILE